MQTLVSDIMHIDNNHFFVTVCLPLKLRLVAYFKDLKESTLGEALKGKINVLRSRRVDCYTIIMDLHRGFKALIITFPGVHVNISGAADDLLKVDIKIR